MAHVDQYGIPCAYIRGGTSKALFFHEKDIPPPGLLRDTVLKRLMGNPDAHQTDGMGGATTHTSKIAIISPPSQEDADVDFTFVQISLDDDSLSYKGNCGNISSGVGPFAIDEGLVKVARKGRSTDDSLTAREVHIYNTNTKKILLSHVPVEESSGFSITTGNAKIAGVHGTSAPILMDYRNSIGGTLGNGLLPSRHAVDCITVGGKDIQISICDVGNISIFVRAVDMGLSGSESAGQITNDSKLIARCKELRGKGAKLIGMCEDWKLVDEQSPGLPFVVLVAAPSHDGFDINARLLFANRCHDTMAGTGAICIAAASQVRGSVVWRELRGRSEEGGVLQIHHPAGSMSISVKKSAKEETTIETEFDVLAFERTSRRLMTGTVFVPKEIWQGPM